MEKVGVDKVICIGFETKNEAKKEKIWLILLVIHLEFCAMNYLIMNYME